MDRQSKEYAINELAHSLRMLMAIVNMMPEGGLKQTLHEELHHIDWCMNIIAPVEEMNHE